MEPHRLTIHDSRLLSRRADEWDGGRRWWRVLIVEDDLAFAELLSTFLSLSEDLTIVGEAHTVATAERLAKLTHPDVVVTDFRLPDGTGADVSRAVQREIADVTVIMLTGDESGEAWEAARVCGVDEYLEKRQSLLDIAAAVRRLAHAR